MFASKKFKFTVMVAAVATAAFLNSCGGKKNAGPSPAQVAASGGFQTVTSPASELEDIQRTLEDRNIPSAIGIGQSNNERIARTTSHDNARAELAASVATQVQRIMESYAQNVNNEAKEIWEEAVRQITNERLQGARPFKTIQQHNAETGQWKIYTLLILDPAIFKNAMMEAMSRNEEFELRVKKDDLLAKMDANIAEYNAKYKR